MFDSFDFDEEQKRVREELLGIKRFKTVDGETLMNKQIDHKVVSDRLLSKDDKHKAQGC